MVYGNVLIWKHSKLYVNVNDEVINILHNSLLFFVNSAGISHYWNWSPRQRFAIQEFTGAYGYWNNTNSQRISSMGWRLFISDGKNRRECTDQHNSYETESDVIDSWFTGQLHHTTGRYRGIEWAARLLLAQWWQVEWGYITHVSDLGLWSSTAVYSHYKGSRKCYSNVLFIKYITRT